MKKRFTLFHLDSERGFRGGERQLLYLAASLRAAGHENVVACRAGSPLDKAARARGLETLHLPFYFEWDPVSAWRLSRAAAARPRPVLLHAHTGHTAALAALASSIGGLPWVAHRRVDFRLSGTLSRRFKYAKAGRVMAVSDNVRKILVEDGVPSGRVSVVPDSLPVSAEEAAVVGAEERLRPPTAEERASVRGRLARQWALPADAPWIGNLAALVPHKDQHTLLGAVPDVLRKRPDARFILVGAGPLERELKAFAKSLGVERSVLFTGFSKEPAAWLHSLDVFALSSWGEGMGSVLLEAMACGVPIVATTAGGIPEVVADKKSGLLVPARDAGRLAAAILEVLEDAQGAVRRSQAALSSLSDFSVTRSAAKVAEIYEEVAR